MTAGLLVVHPSDEPYGADRVMLTVAAALHEVVEVEVLVPQDVEYPEHWLTSRLLQLGIRASAVEMPVLRRAYLRAVALPSLLSRAAAFWRRLRVQRPRWVYLNTSAMLAVAPLVRLAGGRSVAHLHEVWSRRDRLLLAPLLACCTGVVVVSSAVADSLGRASRRARVVHNGFAVPPADPVAAKALRAELGVRDGDLVLLVASRWNAWKGHETLLSAWAQCDRRDLHLVILGSMPASGATTDVEALVAALPDRTRVHVVGESRQVPDWILASDVVVVPSSRPDPLPTIAIEAAALGRGVLGSDSGGIPDIVADGGTGRLVRQGDAQAWLVALQELDRRTVESWGEAATDRFAAEFSLDRFVAAMRSTLTELGTLDTTREVTGS